MNGKRVNTRYIFDNGGAPYRTYGLIIVVTFGAQGSLLIDASGTGRGQHWDVIKVVSFYYFIWASVLYSFRFLVVKGGFTGLIDDNFFGFLFGCCVVEVFVNVFVGHVVVGVWGFEGTLYGNGARNFTLYFVLSFFGSIEYSVGHPHDQTYDRGLRVAIVGVATEYNGGAIVGLLFEDLHLVFIAIGCRCISGTSAQGAQGYRCRRGRCCGGTFYRRFAKFCYRLIPSPLRVFLVLLCPGAETSCFFDSHALFRCVGFCEVFVALLWTGCHRHFLRHFHRLPWCGRRHPYPTSSCRTM